MVSKTSVERDPGLSGRGPLPHVLTFDLASRYSAAVILNPQRELVAAWAFDSGPVNPKLPPTPNIEALIDWIEEIADFVEDVLSGIPLHVVIEDLSHGMANPRPALKFQGALIAALIYENLPQPFELVFPRTWQTQMGYKKEPGQTTKGWAKKLYESLDLGDAVDVKLKGKAMVDVRDAVLIGHWWLQSQENSSST